VKLRGKKIVVLVADGFEDLEYWVTVMRLREEGAEVISVGPGGAVSTARTTSRPGRTPRPTKSTLTSSTGS
jgi:putative intracellular protease/amidase